MTRPSPQLALAATGLVATWLMLRRQARGGRSLLTLPLDVLPIALGWLALASVTQRPVLAAVAILAAGAGLTVTDAVKLATLREKLVFADRAELMEVVRQPQLYLPFAGPAKIVGGALAAAVAVAALFALEPPAAMPGPVGSVLLTASCWFLPGRRPFRTVLANAYRRLGVSGDPAADMRRFGFLACLVMHATIARDERGRRHAAIPPFTGRAASAGPVVLVQIESFFDARRVGAPVTIDLPEFDRLRVDAARSGRLCVPSWGANTVRSEFAALTGIGADALGLDRFNPYERFAQTRTRSLAWALKRAGYRTICLHPFDKRFYDRRRVMPHLGFDEFRGLEAFAGEQRSGLYVSDEAVGRVAARIVRDEGPRVFVFAMTMANHGPWPGDGDEAATLPEGPALSRFAQGLAASDRMLGTLRSAMPEGGVLAVYGDHQPSLPRAFAALEWTDERTDYAVWRVGGRAGAEAELGIEALAELILHVQGCTS